MILRPNSHKLRKLKILWKCRNRKVWWTAKFFDVCTYEFSESWFLDISVKLLWKQNYLHIFLKFCDCCAFNDDKSSHFTIYEMVYEEFSIVLCQTGIAGNLGHLLPVFVTKKLWQVSFLCLQSICCSKQTCIT